MDEPLKVNIEKEPRTITKVFDGVLKEGDKEFPFTITAGGVLKLTTIKWQVSGMLPFNIKATEQKIMKEFGLENLEFELEN